MSKKGDPSLLKCEQSKGHSHLGTPPAYRTLLSRLDARAVHDAHLQVRQRALDLFQRPIHQPRIDGFGGSTEAFRLADEQRAELGEARDHLDAGRFARELQALGMAGSELVAEREEVGVGLRISGAQHFRLQNQVVHGVDETLARGGRVVAGRRTAGSPRRTDHGDGSGGSTAHGEGGPLGPT